MHYICSLPQSFCGPRYDELKDLFFEIQLRTIAMHAWSTISHYLDYKSPHSIPTNLRKDFNALSALFYVVDSHFELFFRSSQEAMKSAEAKAQRLPEIQKEEINFNTLSAYLNKRYSDRKHSQPEIISQLVEELVGTGYDTINQIELVLNKTIEALNSYEGTAQSGWYSDVGAVRISFSIADEKFLHQKKLPPQMIKQYSKYKHLLK